MFKEIIFTEIWNLNGIRKKDKNVNNDSYLTIPRPSYAIVKNKSLSNVYSLFVCRRA